MYGTFLESALKGLSNDGLVNTNERKLQKLYHGLRHGWYLNVCVYVYVQDGEARSPQQLGIIPQTETCSDDLNKTQLLVHVPADCTFFLSMMFVRNAESHSTGPSEYALEGEACSWQRLGVLAPTEAYSGGLDESQRLVYVPKSSHLSGRVRQKR